MSVRDFVARNFILVFVQPSTNATPRTRESRSTDSEEDTLEPSETYPKIDFEGIKITQESRDVIKKYLVELDNELFENNIANPGGLYIPGMMMSRDVISTIIEHFLELDTFSRLKEVLYHFHMRGVWLNAIWRTIHQKIIPEIRDRRAGELRGMEPSETCSETLEGMTITQEDQDIIKKYLVELDDELFENNIANPGGLYTPGMLIPQSAISTIIEHFPELDTFDRLKEVLHPFHMPVEWLDATWTTIRQKIIPAIRDRHEKKQLEMEEEASTRINYDELKALSDEEISELIQHSPILKAEELDPGKMTVSDLARELQWHRLWDNRLPKHRRLQNKSAYVSILQDSIKRLEGEGRTVEEVRRMVEDVRAVIHRHES